MDMRAMHDLKEMLCKELDKITMKGELTAGGLETAHKLTDTIKNIDKIMMLEEDGSLRSLDSPFQLTGINHLDSRSGKTLAQKRRLTVARLT